MEIRDPTGALNVFEYLSMMSDDEATVRQRYTSLNRELFCFSIMLVIFVRNSYYAGKITFQYSNKLAPCIYTTFMVPIGPSCYTMLSTSIILMVLATIAANTILLERAYIAYSRNRWLLALGIITIAFPGPIFIYITRYFAIVKINDKYGCYLDYKFYVPYFRLCVDLPANIIFSIASCLAIYREYQRRHEDCWKKLARNGILTMLLVASSNMLCFALLISPSLRFLGDLMFFADWTIASALLTKSVENLHFIASNSSLPSTKPKIKLQTEHHSIEHVQGSVTSIWLANTVTPNNNNCTMYM
ncbi:hypothetical protein BDF19DRAFT_443181 [Syncephalis fuscata]|nr:hypothetical protein BDF19DRAFT_443181 [Syncephalis fuscata]